MRQLRYKANEVYKKSITMHWEVLKGKATGGIGVKITKFEI